MRTRYLALVTGLASCATSRPAVTPPVPGGCGHRHGRHLDALTLQNWLPNSLSGLPPYLVPAPAGFSRRQGRRPTPRTWRVGVQPTKIKNSSLASAPRATAINRLASPVAMGGSVATAPVWRNPYSGSAAVVAVGTSGDWWLRSSLAFRALDDGSWR